MELAIIGTSNMDQGLATVFSATGNTVVFGSRQPSDAASRFLTLSPRTW